MLVSVCVCRYVGRCVSIGVCVCARYISRCGCVCEIYV